MNWQLLVCSGSIATNLQLYELNVLQLCENTQK
jgi:hypothetical protein